MNTFPERGTHRLRKYRFSEAGGYYFLTSSSYSKRDLFANDKVYKIISDSMEWMESQERWTWFAFMCMPDHVHLIIQLGKKSSLSKAMNSFKGFTGKVIKKELGLKYPVWQDQYFERRILNEEEFWATIGYCYHNPLRKEMVEKPSDYKFWKCKWELG